MKLGAAQSKAPAAWRLVTVELAVSGTSFGFWLNRKKLRDARRREGRYLLRTNLTETDPAKLWEYYLQLVSGRGGVQDAQGRSGDPADLPSTTSSRIEAHIFIAFLAYCLHVTLGHRLKHLAPGLTTRSVLEKFSAVQMIDVHIPTTDGRELTLTRYTQPEAELKLLIAATEDDPAAAAATENQRRPGRRDHPRVVQTYGGRASGKSMRLTLRLPLESAKTG